MQSAHNPFAAPQTLINFLPEDVDYRIQETAVGTWQSFMYENGKTYHEFTSHAELAGLPLFHYTAGKCPETGRSKSAHGVVAVGRFASGIIAIGQVSWGVIAIGQASFGLLVSIGQLAVGFAGHWTGSNWPLLWLGAIRLWLLRDRNVRRGILRQGTVCRRSRAGRKESLQDSSVVVRVVFRSAKVRYEVPTSGTLSRSERRPSQLRDHSDQKSRESIREPQRMFLFVPERFERSGLIENCTGRSSQHAGHRILRTHFLQDRVALRTGDLRNDMYRHEWNLDEPTDLGCHRQPAAHRSTRQYDRPDSVSPRVTLAVAPA